MSDHLIIDASRQPSQIRCLHCGFAQDLRMPMAIKELVALERRINAEHRGCKPPAPRFTPSGTARSNAGPGPTTAKPPIVPKPQFPSPRVIREDFLP